MSRSDNPAINTYADLLKQVKSAAPADKLGLLKQHLDKVTTFEQFIELLPLLKGADRYLFARAHESHEPPLNSPIINGVQLAEVLNSLSSERLPDDYLFILAMTYQRVIQSSGQMSLVFNKLPPDEHRRTIFVLDARVESFDDLEKKISLLTGRDYKQWRRPQAPPGRALVQRENEQFLPTGIDDGYSLSLALAYKEFITDKLQLSRLCLKLNPKSRLDFLRENLDKIGEDGLVGMTYLLSDEDKITVLKEHQDDIQSYSQLEKTLAILPQEERLTFARTHRNLIENEGDLIKTTETLPEKDRFTFLMENRTKITSGLGLFNAMSHLPSDDKIIFYKEFQDNILDSRHLQDTLETLAQDERLAFAMANQDKIRDPEDLMRIINYLPRESRLAFAMANQDKTGRTSNDLDFAVFYGKGKMSRLAFTMAFVTKNPDIIDFNGFNTLVANIEEGYREGAENWDEEAVIDTLTDSERRVLLEAFNQAYRIALARQYNRDSFADPIMQQLIVQQKVDANAFLFAAALNPVSDADFELFLTHPLCSVTALNERAQNLELAIQEQPDLDPALKAHRIARVKEMQKLQRAELGKQTIGFNLSSVKQTELSFTGTLPDVPPATWSIPDVDEAEIKRFHQLIKWLQTQEILAYFKEDFSALENNQAIRTSALFKPRVEALDAFVAELALYLKRNPHLTADSAELKSLLEASNQLGVCAEGVLSGLQSMTRSLNPSASIAKVVDIALYQALRGFINLTGIREGLEVHTSKDRLLGLLGLNATYGYDPYRLPISPAYLRAIANDAAGRLTPDYLISESRPNLESLQLKPADLILKDATLLNLLERDWEVLFTTGLLTELRLEPRDKWGAVMCYIGKINLHKANGILDAFAEGNLSQQLPMTLSEEELTTRYQFRLKEQGILTKSPEAYPKLKEDIWRLLTDPHRDPTLNDTFNQILTATNGLSLIKAVIESHSIEEQKSIRLQALLHFPEGSSTNIFRSFATDPYLAGWMMGWEIKRTPIADTEKATLTFNSRPSPLDEALGQFPDETSMHKEFEEIFIMPGNLLFWLGVLKKDPTLGRDTLLESIMSFLNEQETKDRCKFDNLLVVLDHMMSVGEEEQQITAKSFLEDRCKQQKELGLYHCYWETASHIHGFKPDFTNRDLLLSLQDPVKGQANAQAAIFILKSREALDKKLSQATASGHISSDELEAIKASIQKLYPQTASPSLDDEDYDSEEDDDSTHLVA